MKVVFAITTYNRIALLSGIIDCWTNTKSKKYDWTLIVGDDGSTDGTIEYLKNLNPNCNYWWFSVNRKGVHHLNNWILRHLSETNFDFCFKTEDDIKIKAPKWDEHYIEASQATGYDHLVLYDPEWERKINHLRDPQLVAQNKWVQSYVINFPPQGAFWTLTPKVIKTIGYFDVQTFGAATWGHVDYTYRACKAGFNHLQTPFDAINSQDYICLELDNYQPACQEFSLFWKRWPTGDIIASRNYKYNICLDQKRLYIPYSEMKTILL